MTKTKTSTLHEVVIEHYENPDFASVVRKTCTTTRVEASGAETKASTRSVYSAANVKHADYCKALVLALARYGTLMELPYTVEGISDAHYADADAAQWYY